MVNATASKIRVLIGPSAIDFSEALISFAAGFDKRDRNGIAKISGTLVLTALDNNVALLNPRLNYDIGGGIIPRALWSRGQYIRFQSTNDSGTLIDHRFSKLYILKEPLPPKSPKPQDARITLEVGCEYKLRDFAAPNPNPLLACDPEDPTLSNVGIVQSPGAVIQKLQVKAGMTGTWEGAIENYPFYYPVSNDSGSYVAVAGEVAYPRFYSLVQKRSPAGNLTAVNYRADVNATPLLTVTIGEDEAEYMPVAGQETPCEELHVTGSTYDVTDTWQDTTVCKITYAPGSNLVTRITCTRDAQDATQILHEVEEQEPKGLLAPDDFPGNDTLIFSRRTTKIKTYEVNVCGNGKLLTEGTRITRPFRVAVSEFWSGLSSVQKASYSAFNPSLDTYTIVYYHYTAKEVADEIETRTSRMLASVLPSVNPSTAGVIFQVPAASEIQTYREISPGQWEYTQAAASPLIDVFPDSVPDSASVSEKIRLATTNPISTVSGSGQNNPPAAERRPQRYARNERQLDGMALFGSFAGANQQDRRRYVSVSWMVSNEQASAVAQQVGSELIGRRQGAQILLGLTDAWLTNENPYPVIHVREPRWVFSGTWSVVYDTIVYQVDGLSFSHDRASAKVGCELIWLATIPAGASVPVLPYIPSTIKTGTAGLLQLFGDGGTQRRITNRTGQAGLLEVFADGGKGAIAISRTGQSGLLEIFGDGGIRSSVTNKTAQPGLIEVYGDGGSRSATATRTAQPGLIEVYGDGGRGGSSIVRTGQSGLIEVYGDGGKYSQVAGRTAQPGLIEIYGDGGKRSVSASRSAQPGLIEVYGDGGKYVSGDGVTFSNVKLLLHGEGANNGTTFTDSSSLANTITRSGTPVTSTTQFKFGSSSIYFDGSADYLILPTSQTAFNPGSGDFTFECWFYTTNTALGCLFNLVSSSSVQMYAGTPGVYYYDVSLGGISATPTITQNAWHYYGCSRTSGALKISIDGTIVKTGTSTATLASGYSQCRIGRDNGTSNDFQGYIDEVRWTVGQSKDITVVPTAAFPDS